MLSIARVVSVAAVFAVVTPVVLTETGCSSSSAAAKKKKKSGGNKGAGAQSAGQKAGGAAEGGAKAGANKGAEYEQVTCDAALEGVAWCDDAATVVTCVGGSWYAVSCLSLNGGVCAEDDNHIIDCDAENEVE